MNSARDPLEMKGASHPLSLTQSGMWFLDRLVPGSPLYSVPWVVRFRGMLYVAALRAAVGEIVRRHEALRTRFEARDGVPEQVVDDDLAFEWRYRDLGTGHVHLTRATNC